MTYQLPPDVDETVKRYMESGCYASEEEVLREALVALHQREQEKLKRWHERNQLSIEQSKQGLSKPLDDAKILSRLRERLAKDGIVD